MKKRSYQTEKTPKIKSKTLSSLPEVFKRGKKEKKTVWAVIMGILLVGFFLWSLDPVNINFRPMFKNDPEVLRVFAPSVVEKDTEVEFTVECWDYCERLAGGYGGEVEFSAVREKPGTNGTIISASADFSKDKYKFSPSLWSQGFIEAYRIPWGDGGYKTFSASFKETGIHYITVKDKSLSDEIFYSNPIIVTEDKPEKLLLWGDIHGHSSKCDGSGYLDPDLFYAKNIACLDFASVSTHDHFVNALIAPIGWKVNWEDTINVINNWNEKDDFASLQSYEWRGNYLKNADPQGDRVVYSKTGEIPFFSGADKRYATEELLNRALKDWMSEDEERKVMTIAHHPPHAMMGMRTDLSYFDPEITRLVEIYSLHGSSEMHRTQGNKYPIIGGNGYKPYVMELDDEEGNYVPGYHVRDALSMGYHLGFMSSGDSHDGHIGHSISHTEARHLWQPPLAWSAYANHMFRCHHWRPNGLVGVFADELSREEIFDGLWSRASYAVKGTSRPYVNFTINGTMIGEQDSILSVPNSNADRLINLDVASGGGDGNFIHSIQIIKNNEVWKEIDLTGQQLRVFHGSWLDNTTIEGTSYWEYADLDAEEYKKDSKYYINEDADNGAEEKDFYSTKGEDFYYVKVYTEGSKFYSEMYDYYNVNAVPRGYDLAWVGPIWVKPQ